MLVPFPRHPSASVRPRPESADRVEQRAMAIWPRLNHRALHRCYGDPSRIARYVARRTTMPAKDIESLISDRQT